MAEMPRKAVLWNQLKLARESGIPIVELDQKAYVSWTEAELQSLSDRYVGDTYRAPGMQTDNTEQFIDEHPVHQPTDDTDYVESFESVAARVAAANPRLAGAVPTPPTAELPPDTGRMPEPERVQSGWPPATPEGVPPRDEWAQIAPETLARLLKVPFTDKAAQRAGLTFNTHGPNDPLRVDTLGRVWYKDEVVKRAIPLPRMRRKVRALSNSVEVKNVYYPDGRLDESFEVAGSDMHEIEVKITLPASQVGVYYDPRMPFKIHQYNGRRAFDHDEVRDFYGGLVMIPTRIQGATTYIDSDLCFDINVVRDTMEQELRDKLLGRSF